MTVVGAILRVPGSGFRTNIWRVTYRFKWNEQVLEHETLVTGINTCSGFEGELKAAWAVAKLNGNRPTKIIKVEFVGTGIVSGVEEEALNMRLECVYDKETGKPKPLPYI